MKVFSIKLDNGLYQQLSSSADDAGLSKGALVKNALISYLNRASPRAGIVELTKNLISGSASRHKVDWKKIRESAHNLCTITPEEEIILTRKRGL